MRERLCDGVLYIGSLLLVLEWIYPIPDFTHTNNIVVFMVALIVFFAVTWIRMAPLLRFILRVVIIVSALYFSFPVGGSQSWWAYFVQELVGNPLSLVRLGTLMEVTDFYRTFLFLLVLALISHILFYWVVYGHRILLFVTMTLLFLVTVDAMTVYDAGAAVMRVFVIGLFLLMLLRFTQQQSQAEREIGTPVKGIRGVMTLGSACIVFALVIGYLLPKAGPVVGDGPTATGTGASGAARTGYGEDDRKLGGPLKQDETVIFYAQNGEQTYFKGETKNFYTGSGWELQFPELMEEKHFIERQFETERARADIVSFSKEETVTYFFQEENMFDHVFYPGELQDASIVSWNEETNAEEIYDMQMNRLSNKVTLQNDKAPPRVYELTYRQPIYDFKALEEYDVQYDEDDENVRLFTMLPESLPARVREKAQEVVGDEVHPYMQAKAIERYLKGIDFHYETDDIPPLEEGDDYVDQFLFETQRGYCEQFSTAMAVMLRTLDVPSRWVKGFTGGEKSLDAEVEAENDDRPSYMIKNRHAHTWVEVYFPEVGWVPFEPTPGFTGISNEAQSNTDEQTRGTPDRLDEQDAEETAAQLESDIDRAASENEDQSHLFSDLKSLLALVVMLMCVGLVIVRLFDQSIVRVYARRHFQKQNSSAAFAKAYTYLLLVLEMHGYERKKPQTLAAYAEVIDTSLGGHDMRALTSLYEQYVYGDCELDIARASYEKHWKMLLAKIKS